MESSRAAEFLAALSIYLRRHGYHVGLETGDLVTERESNITEFAAGKVLEVLGLRGGSTGVKELASDKVSEALTPLVGNEALTPLVGKVELFAWKTSQLIPVLIADGMSAPDLKLLLDSFLKFGLRSAGALSLQKYGGYLHIYPLVVFTGTQADLTALRDVKISEQETSFWLRVYVDAAVITLRDRKIAWVKGVAVPQELSGLFTLLS